MATSKIKGYQFGFLVRCQDARAARQMPPCLGRRLGATKPAALPEIAGGISGNSVVVFGCMDAPRCKVEVTKHTTFLVMR